MELEENETQALKYGEMNESSSNREIYSLKWPQKSIVKDH